MAIARVFLDIPTRSISGAFDYLIPCGMEVQVGCCVLVEFGHRPSLGYVIELTEEAQTSSQLKPIKELLSTPFFDQDSADLAQWISQEYLAPLSEAIHLFLPPGATPRLKKSADGFWQLEHPGVGPVDDRWACLLDSGSSYEPPANAIKQKAILDVLKQGEIRVAELGLSVSNPAASLKALEKRGVIKVESRRRLRGLEPAVSPQGPRVTLTQDQSNALALINKALDAQNGSTILIDGITGSGKTEVYLQAIEQVLTQGGSACVLVPEISLTPQTVARFRARFGAQVAVLHSRLSVGERYDQWDLVRCGAARVVVGARSALFAPLHNLKLIIIDEEHESSYKQSSSPNYVTRDVAAHMMKQRQGTLLLGSASPSMETLYQCELGNWQQVVLTQRATGGTLPPVEVVDLAQEFARGNKTMFSQALSQALQEIIQRNEKAVLLLNKRGFASFLLCRDCGHVPTCTECSTSLTFHQQRGAKNQAKPNAGFLMCHHCGQRHEPPQVCPVCGSPYLRQLGPGTQFAAQQLAALLPEGTPIIRMDADTTTGKGAHQRLLDEFAAAPTGVLLGTQMIAKGLDFPDVTLVGVLIADTTLNVPDFRSAERTFDLLEQVAGRAGRGIKPGRVIVQTYRPQHPAVLAAAAHNRELLLPEERQNRQELGYPPYKRLANLVLWGADNNQVLAEAKSLYQALFDALPAEDLAKGSWQLLGPAPCVLSRLNGKYRWHILVKAPLDSPIPQVIEQAIRNRKPKEDVRLSVDIDPYDLM